MKTQLLIIAFLTSFIFTSQAQESNLDTKQESIKKVLFRFQGDSRQTLINRKSVGIIGIRFGALFDEKKEIGIGVYSSNLFGLLGSSVTKDYQDKSVDPPIALPAEIGFHYFSVYGEYVLIKNKRLIFTANTQLGVGWVDIKIIEASAERDKMREGKGLVEHSIKADVQTFKWLRLMGGIGYRYLVAGETQIKEAFNAPIYIVGFSIDFKRLFKKGSKNKN